MSNAYIKRQLAMRGIYRVVNNFSGDNGVSVYIKRIIHNDPSIIFKIL